MYSLIGFGPRRFFFFTNLFIGLIRKNMYCFNLRFSNKSNLNVIIYYVRSKHRIRHRFLRICSNSEVYRCPRWSTYAEIDSLFVLEHFGAKQLGSSSVLSKRSLTGKEGRGDVEEHFCQISSSKLSPREKLRPNN